MPLGRRTSFTPCAEWDTCSRPEMPLSIRWRLTIGIAAAIIVTLIVILVTLRLALGGILEADLDDDLSRHSGLVAARAAPLGSPGGRGYGLARGAVKPLREVIDVAAEIGASDLSRRIGAKASPAEVQALAETFDAMLERLDAAFQQQRNFVLDMSPQLRPPVTRPRGGR